MRAPDSNLRQTGIIGLAVVGAMFWHAASWGAETRPANAPRALPDKVTGQMVMAGRELFHDRGGCFRCHGEKGHGSFWAPALDDAARLHLPTASYDEILSRIRTGVPRPKRHLAAMPPLGGAHLSDEEARAVAAYVYTLDRGP